MTSRLQNRLAVAAAILNGKILSATIQLETDLKATTRELANLDDASARAEALLEALAIFSRSPDLPNKLGALKTIREFATTLEVNPQAQLSYEFYAGNEEDYPGGDPLEMPIDENKLSGRTAALVEVLKLAGARIEWPPRTNFRRIGFVVKEF